MPRAVPAFPARSRARTADRALFVLVLCLFVASESLQAKQLDDVFEADFYRPTAFLDERDRRLTELFEKVDAARVEERWRDWCELIQDVLETEGTQNAVFGARTYRDARLEARGRLLRAPSEARALYRELFEPRARERLAAAASDRRPEVWIDVALRHPLTESAEIALQRLAALAFERADYGEAARWCERLDEIARAEDRPTEPDVLARWLVSLSELGSRDAFSKLAGRIEAASDSREARVAGRSIALTDLAGELEPRATGFEVELPSFAANAVDPAWKVELSFLAGGEPKLVPVATVSGSRLLVHSIGGLQAIDIESGRRLWEVSAAKLMGRAEDPPEGGERPVLRFPWIEELGIAADEEHVYLVRSERHRYRDRLICLSAASGELLRRRGDADDLSFGDLRLCLVPAAHGGRLYVSAIEEATPLEAELLAIETESGEVEWNRFLAAGRALASGDRFSTANTKPLRPGDPALGAEGLFVLTNLGVLACVDPWEERVRWLFHYSRVRDVSSLPPEKIGYFEVEPWSQGELRLRANDLLVTPGDSEWAYALSRLPDEQGRVLTAEPLFKAPPSLRALVGAGEDIVLFEQYWQKRFRLATYSKALELEWVSMPLSAHEQLIGPPLVTQKQVIYATSRRLYFLDLERDGSLVHIQSAPELETDGTTPRSGEFGRFLVAGDLLVTISSQEVRAWRPR